MEDLMTYDLTPLNRGELNRLVEGLVIVHK